MRLSLLILNLDSDLENKKRVKAFKSLQALNKFRYIHET